MYCVLKGKVCVMVFDEAKNKYRFFPVKRWDRMSIEQKQRYRIDD